MTNTEWPRTHTCAGPIPSRMVGGQPGPGSRRERFQRRRANHERPPLKIARSVRQEIGYRWQILNGSGIPAATRTLVGGAVPGSEGQHAFVVSVDHDKRSPYVGSLHDPAQRRDQELGALLGLVVEAMVA